MPTTGAVNPSFAIGGAAFLKTWFDIYEGESALTSRDPKKPSIIEVAAGDTFGGATPPISNFFGDKPTPPIMGMMGIDVDTRRQPQLRPGARRTTGRSCSRWPTSRCSARTSSYPDGKYPKEW